jgi:flotillin
VIGQLPEIVRAASEPLSAISNLTVISSDGSGTEQVGENVATQLKTATQLLKDLVGIDIAEIVNGRVTGEAIGAGIASGRTSRPAAGPSSAPPAPAKATAKPAAKGEPTP